ncbi:hypothetical protein ACIBI9_43055 [Nonomuraea sp. NPDC050451]|uniref:hypothetical protein n=1 Tax=Nonomuraea sp. NPDC050451 TaxID=3364364 RepID=UPI00379CF047
MSTRGNGKRLRMRGLRAHGVRALTVGGALAASLLAVAGPAHAATDVGVSGSELQIFGGAASDNIDVSLSGRYVIVSNAGDSIATSAPCKQQSANRVACPADQIESILALTGEGDDTMRNRTRLPMKAHLAPGRDNLISGNGVATIGGSGNVIEM